MYYLNVPDGGTVFVYFIILFDEKRYCERAADACKTRLRRATVEPIARVWDFIAFFDVRKTTCSTMLCIDVSVFCFVFFFYYYCKRLFKIKIQDVSQTHK